jgi:hypothetical protein
LHCPVCGNFIRNSNMIFCEKCGTKVQTSAPIIHTRNFYTNNQTPKVKPIKQKDPNSKRGVLLSLISIAISLISLGWAYYSYLNPSASISYYPSFEDIIPPFLVSPMLSVIGMIILLVIFSIAFLLIIFAFKFLDQGNMNIYNKSSRNTGLFFSTIGGILSVLSIFVVLIYLIAFLVV